MPTVTLEEAQAQLPELIDRLHPGEEIIITRDHQPVARLIGEARPEAKPRQLGTMKGSVLYMAPDFDAPLDDFKEYMG
jgi:antitoxin (DNA-binding transcriptional repressor) of toxin-antitoxin stability system